MLLGFCSWSLGFPEFVPNALVLFVADRSEAVHAFGGVLLANEGELVFGHGFGVEIKEDGQVKRVDDHVRQRPADLSEQFRVVFHFFQGRVRPLKQHEEFSCFDADRFR